MFTGLVEEVGKLKHIRAQGEALLLTISANKILQDVQIGDSIAVNGVCLTVTSYDSASFVADVMPETFRKTTLQQLSPGDPINVERAMSATSRFGGHIVQGHVDGTGIVVSREVDANAVVFTIRPSDPEVFRYIIPKGSITIDGISLTVVHADGDTFSVSIIPHTLAETALNNRKSGAKVNLECDIIGKYVEHLLHFNKPNNKEKNYTITESYLAEHGFM